jgi:hypothetical protein
MIEPMDTSRKASGEGRLRGLPVFGSAAAGLLLGHALSYMLAVPDPYHRDLVMARTGHGYLPAASQAAVIMALAAVAAILARAWSNRDRGETERFSSIAGTLASVQIGAFVALEILERVVAGAPLGDLMRDHLLVIGIVVQVMVSLAGAAILAWFARTSALIVSATSGRPAALLRPILVQALPATPDHTLGRIVASARNVRGPPSARRFL